MAHVFNNAPAIDRGKILVKEGLFGFAYFEKLYVRCAVDKISVA